MIRLEYINLDDDSTHNKLAIIRLSKIILH